MTRRVVGSQDVELVPLAVNVRRRARSGTSGSGRVGLARLPAQDQPGLALCRARSQLRRRVSIPALRSVIVGGGCLTTGWQRGRSAYPHPTADHSRSTADHSRPSNSHRFVNGHGVADTQGRGLAPGARHQAVRRAEPAVVTEPIV